MDQGDFTSEDHPGDPSGVILMKMREHDQRDSLYPQSSQTTIHQPRIGAGIDNHPGPTTCIEHDAIALAHITHHHHPVLWRPPGGRQGYHDDGKQHS